MLFVLRWRYGDDFLSDPGENGDWFNEALIYPFDTVNRAVRYYCEACDEPPTLNTFCIVLDEIYSNRVDDFFRLKSDAGVRCKICNDFGYTIFNYPTKVQLAHACKCEAGDQYEAYRGDTPMSDADCLSRYGVSLAELDAKKIRTARRPRIQLDMHRTAGLEHAKRIGAPHANARSMANRVVIYDVFYG